MNMNNKIKTALFSVLTLSFLTFFAACDENGGITIPSGVTELTVSVKSDDIALSNPADVIIITEAKALVRELEFEQETSGNEQLHQLGPFVINFNVDGSLKETGTQMIIRDKYSKVKFQLHKPENTETPPDPEFKIGSADNQRFSFIVKGTYNGAPFIYRTKQGINLVININPVININLRQQNVTMIFNKSAWFMNGTTVLNPNDPANESLIDENIKNSFKKAFKDDDKNGLPDDN